MPASAGCLRPPPIGIWSRARLNCSGIELPRPAQCPSPPACALPPTLSPVPPSRAHPCALIRTYRPRASPLSTGTAPRTRLGTVELSSRPQPSQPQPRVPPPGRAAHSGCAAAPGATAGRHRPPASPPAYPPAAHLSQHAAALGHRAAARCTAGRAHSAARCLPCTCRNPNPTRDPTALHACAQPPARGLTPRCTHPHPLPTGPAPRGRLPAQPPAQHRHRAPVGAAPAAAAGAAAQHPQPPPPPGPGHRHGGRPSVAQEPHGAPR